MERDEWVKRVLYSSASNDAKVLTIYQRFVSDAGLFDKAFFGHKKSRKEARRLASLWQMSIKLVTGRSNGQENTGPSSTDTTDGVPGAGSPEGSTDGSDPSLEAEA